MRNTNGRMVFVLITAAFMLALVMTAATPDATAGIGDPKDTLVVPPDSTGASAGFNPYGSATSDSGEIVSEQISIDVAKNTIHVCLKTLLTWGIIVY